MVVTDRHTDRATSVAMVCISYAMRPNNSTGKSAVDQKLLRPHTLDSVSDAGFGRATPHAWLR